MIDRFQTAFQQIRIGRLKNKTHKNTKEKYHDCNYANPDFQT